MIILAELTPLDTVAGTRKTVRATNANDQRVTGLNSLVWRPAISELPSLAMRLFKGDFDGTFSPAVGGMALQVDQLEGFDANVRRFFWQGASVKLWAGTLGQAWPWTQIFDGIVGEGPSAENNKVTLPLKVNTEPFDADILTLKYAGTGSAEGGGDLKDKVKPWLLGRCFNVEPVLINATYSIYQFSAYGAIQGVSKLYERGSDFGASSGDYASYAALQAATIAAGSWATCKAEGLVRLGAPQYGVITGDVDGDAPGGTWRRKTGEIITRVATNAGASAGLDATSLTALDTALAGLSNQGRIGVYLTDQEKLIDFAARLAAPCNAQAGISLMGKLFVARVGSLPSPTLTLDAQQRQMPRVVESSETGVSPPFSLVQMGYARAWRVHTADEVAFADPLYTNLAGRPLTYRVVARGISSSYSTSAGITDEEGASLGTGARSYNVAVFSRATGALVSHTTYDVFGSTANATAMASALNALDNTKIVVIYTYDEPQNNRTNGGLEAAMYRCGASAAVFGSFNLFKYRSAYVLIGIPDIGKGNGYEAYAGATDSSTTAWVDVPFSIYNGLPITSGVGTTNSSVLDLDYYGELNATYGATGTDPVGSITATDVSATIASGGGVASNQVSTGAIQADAVSERPVTTLGTGFTLSMSMQLVLDLTLPAGTAGELQAIQGAIDAYSSNYEGSMTSINITVEQCDYSTGSLYATLISNRTIASFSDENTTSGFSAPFSFTTMPDSTNRRYKIYARHNDSTGASCQTSSFAFSTALKR